MLDDIRDLWEVGLQLEGYFLAAAYAAPLHHVNAGILVYNLRMMREQHFTGLTLLAAQYAVSRSADGQCVRDQGILNLMNEEAFLKDVGIHGTLLRFLPFRWSLFPAVDWHPSWGMPDLWPVDMVLKRRYPGIISRNHVEHYCPDVADLLSAFAFVPLTGSRQARIREYATLGAQPETRYCSPHRIGSPCCTW